MTNYLVVGAQWGDEGKGRVVDYLTEKSDIITRFQGGANAGHTVIVGDEQYILHQVPSGILHKDKTCIVGNGVVLEPVALLKEMEELEQRGLSLEKLKISDTVHIIMFYHKVLDQVKEMISKKAKKIGTTGRGIGPSYADKINRCGIRMCDLLNEEIFKEKLVSNLNEKLKVLKAIYELSDEQIQEVVERNNGTNFFVDGKFNVDEILKVYKGYAEKMSKYVANTSLLLNKEVAAGKTVLFEGAQGTLLDIDHGTYPFVTSSNTTIGGVASGLGIDPRTVEVVIGIVKAYVTRVGAGPMVTELADENKLKEDIENYQKENGKDSKIQMTEEEDNSISDGKADDYLLGKGVMVYGAEYGATTGRPRRCGWVDLVVVNHSLRINGIDKIALTKLDVLDKFPTIKICVAYDKDGEEIDYFPSSLEELGKCNAKYIEVPGWKEDTTKCTSYDDLPENAKLYIKKLEELLKTPISFVGVGPKRDQTLILDKDL